MPEAVKEQRGMTRAVRGGPGHRPGLRYTSYDYKRRVQQCYDPIKMSPRHYISTPSYHEMTLSNDQSCACLSQTCQDLHHQNRQTPFPHDQLDDEDLASQVRRPQKALHVSVADVATDHDVQSFSVKNPKRYFLPNPQKTRSRSESLLALLDPHRRVRQMCRRLRIAGLSVSGLPHGQHLSGRDVGTALAGAVFRRGSLVSQEDL